MTSGLLVGSDIQMHDVADRAITTKAAHESGLRSLRARLEGQVPWVARSWRVC